MPPRASHPRASRGPSREPEQRASPASNLQRPHLPELQGTPSSRRQYSYGAGVEPLPARPGRNLGSGQVMDLGSAVRDAIQRQDQEEIQEKREAAGRRTRRNNSDEDELAGSSMPPPPVPQADTTLPGLSTSLLQGSFFDDTRSFGTESNLFDDATIASSPGAPSLPSQPPPPPAETPSQRLRSTRQRASQLRPETAEQPVNLPPPKGPAASTSQDPRARFGATVRDEETAPANSLGSPQKTINTPAVRRGQPRAAQGLFGQSTSNPRNDLAGDDGELRRPSRARPAKPLFSIDDDFVNRQTAGQSSGLSTGRQQAAASSSSTQTRSRVQTDKPPQLRGNRPSFRTDASEQDEAMQREIEQSERQAAREARTQARRETWIQGWQWLKSQPPLSFFQPGAHRDESDNGSEVDEDHDLVDDDGITMWQLLNPITYIKAILWLLEEIFGSYFTRLWTKLSDVFERVRNLDIWHQLGSQNGPLAPLLLAVAVGFASFLLFPFLRNAYQDASIVDLDISRFGENTWQSLNNAAHSIGGYIPKVSWPSASWPTSSRWDDLGDHGDLDDADRSQLQNLLRKYEKEIKRMRKAEKLHEASIKKLEQVVPRIVHMEMRNGKPVIEQDFWHALRDLLVDDGAFLSLDKKGSKFEVASDRQWQSIVSKLSKDPAFTAKLSSNVKEAESQIEKKWSTSWETWVKNNDNKIAKILGPKLEKVMSSKSDKELLAQVEKLLKNSDGKPRPSGEVVTRAEFLRHLQSEFSAHKAEIRAQLDDHQPQLEQFIRDTVDVATSKTPKGMTRAEATELIDTVVRKSIADLNLAALAKGEIHAHLDAELRNMVNYFAIGSGATIDHQLSSATYKLKPLSRKEAAKKALQIGLLDVRPQPQISALTPWFDEGDCWCAALSRDHALDRHGASLSIQLGHFVVPRTIVVEHILSGATNDPGARPRDIEIWAHVDDPSVRDAVRGFAHTHFARYDNSYEGGAPRPAGYPERFVRIGRFVYDEGAERHGGVHVHQLSPEVVSLGVETDQVIVRAVTNHGSLDHTCFYRVRMYGTKVEDVAEQQK